jgi:hypothetical protein
MSLRYLVGGNPLDICFGYGLSNKTFYSPKSGIWNVLEAIYEVTKDDIQLGEPIKIQIKSHGETEHDMEALLSRDSHHANLEWLSHCCCDLLRLLHSSPLTSAFDKDIFQHNLVTLVLDYITDAIVLRTFTDSRSLQELSKIERGFAQYLLILVLPITSQSVIVSPHFLL